jgi:nitrite reductase (NADH) small subunit
VAFQRVARVGEIPPGQTRYFVVGRAELVLANRSGRIYALHGRCPHQGNPLEGAALWDNLLTCPWHQFQYDVATGENHYPKNVYPPDLPRLQAQVRPLRTYPVDIRGGEIWVDL